MSWCAFICEEIVCLVSVLLLSLLVEVVVASACSALERNDFGVHTNPKEHAHICTCNAGLTVTGSDGGQ